MKLLPADTSNGPTSIVVFSMDRYYISVDWGFSSLETLMWEFQRDMLYAVGLPKKYLFPDWKER